MVVTPKDRKKISNAQINLMLYLESKIDESLLEGRGTFSVDLFRGLRSPEDLLDKYRRSGWEVKHVPDWRDGNYYQFQEKRT